MSGQLGLDVPQLQECRLAAAGVGMKASEFEYRHQTLVHLLIVGAAFLTYLVDRDDIVWVLVRGRPDQYLLERELFGVAAALIGIGALLRTWAAAKPEAAWAGAAVRVRSDGPYRYVRYPRQLGNLLFSIGLAFLAPIAGFLLLVLGETLMAVRLIQHERQLRNREESSAGEAWRSVGPISKDWTALRVQPSWGKAFRWESAKWGLFLTMIVFTVLLRDRVAEVLAGASFLVWAVLNWAAPANSASRS